ncbi:hypothetical protein M514_01855 [Trichuris suis]|uniref:Uncharacterized protein n=1 Tax=Trichuris suis TaxID=68888 RepID=A0A085MJE8_9BILA|nr:hypothetical protein M513_01855 [Trichuris suis]KFD72728.1 hypothetical protein M514_01855 [Trichuris suis]
MLKSWPTLRLVDTSSNCTAFWDKSSSTIIPRFVSRLIFSLMKHLAIGTGANSGLSNISYTCTSTLCETSKKLDANESFSVFFSTSSTKCDLVPILGNLTTNDVGSCWSAGCHSNVALNNRPTMPMLLPKALTDMEFRISDVELISHFH